MVALADAPDVEALVLPDVEASVDMVEGCAYDTSVCNGWYLSPLRNKAAAKHSR